MMALGMKKDQGCLCRVPLGEIAGPGFARDSDRLEWLASRGCEVRNDHQGRLSISVADAQAIWDEFGERAVRELEERQRITNEAHNAGLERERVFGAAYAEAKTKPAKNGDEWVRAANAAVREYEKTLSREVRAAMAPMNTGIFRAMGV